MALQQTEMQSLFPKRDIDPKKHEIVEIEGQEVVQVKLTRIRSEMSKTLYNELNKMWAQFQITGVAEEDDFRETFYQCRFITKRRTGFEIDYKGDSDQQYITYHGTIKGYCEKIQAYYGAEYWGHVRDIILNIRVKDTCEVFGDGEAKLLTRENRKRIAAKGLFCYFAEKKSTAKQMYQRLSRAGYPCIAITSSGYGVVEIVLTIMEYKEQVAAGDHFYILVAHDLDINGIAIYLDLLQWFPNNTFSVGVSPEFLDFNTDLDFNMLNEPYRPDSKHITGLDNKIANFRKGGRDEQADSVNAMKNSCLTSRVELNTVTGYRKSQGVAVKDRINDLYEWCLWVMEQNCTVWNINRVGGHAIATQQGKVTKIEQWLKTKIWAPFNQILEDNERVGYSDWRKPAKDRKKEFKKDNHDFSGDITKVREIFRDQSNVLSKICKEDETSLETIELIYEKFSELADSLTTIFGIVLPECPDCGYIGEPVDEDGESQCFRCGNWFKPDEDE